MDMREDLTPREGNDHQVSQSVGKSEMTTENTGNLHMLGLSSKPAWAQTWHLWRVIIPRRSITGRLVFGKVWRRHDGRHWIYKAVIEKT